MFIFLRKKRLKQQILSILQSHFRKDYIKDERQDNKDWHTTDMTIFNFKRCNRLKSPCTSNDVGKRNIYNFPVKTIQEHITTILHSQFLEDFKLKSNKK